MTIHIIPLVLQSLHHPMMLTSQDIVLHLSMMSTYYQIIIILTLFVPDPLKLKLAPPPGERPPTFDATKSTSEARRARLEMERSWASSLTCSGNPESSQMIPDQRVVISKQGIGLCFPGSGSQYIGIGSLLLPDLKGFCDTWDEAEEAFIGFEHWRQSLDLVNCLHALGYTSDQANLREVRCVVVLLLVPMIPASNMLYSMALGMN